MTCLPQSYVGRSDGQVGADGRWTSGTDDIGGPGGTGTGPGAGPGTPPPPLHEATRSRSGYITVDGFMAAGRSNRRADRDRRGWHQFSPKRPRKIRWAPTE